uniref:Bm711 n=1 Tax=Brugia malayi TaxID=6279 RepID=A0A1I9G560_BRUMA|nr:Bm711 [Brugia malayi]
MDDTFGDGISSRGGEGRKGDLQILFYKFVRNNFNNNQLAIGNIFIQLKHLESSL